MTNNWQSSNSNFKLIEGAPSDPVLPGYLYKPLLGLRLNPHLWKVLAILSSPLELYYYSPI